MADDDDDVAIDGGAEPAEEQVAAGGPIVATIPGPKGTRPISDKVRQVFAASMKAKPVAEAEDEGGLEPVDAEEAEVPAPEPVAAAVEPIAPVAPPVAPIVPVVAPAPVVPPAPSLDPEVMRMRTDLEQQRQAFDQERAKFAESQRTTDIAKLRDTYFDKGAPAISEIIKQWMPGLSEDEIKDEITDLIQDLGHQYLGVPLDQSVKDRIATKRTRAGLKAWRTEQERIEEDRQKKQLASQEEQNRVRVKQILHQEVTKPEHATQFPFLASEANAGDLVFETIDQEYRTNGSQLTWQDAAKRVDDWLKSQALAFYDKRKHLLSPPAPPQPAEKQRTQGDTQVSRSQAPPKRPPQQPETATPQKWTPETHRQKTVSKFRNAFRASNDE